MTARIILVSVLAVALPACGGGAKGRALRVVASTNVYGDLVHQIGGPHVAVTSVLSDPQADPHLFEPGTANGLAVSQARVVVQNGLGYDDFMTKLEHAAPSSSRRVLVIADVVAHGVNPHLWYELPQMARVADAIARQLSAADPAHARAYRSGAQRFASSLAPLLRALHALPRGARVASTEPVPGYLLEAAGLRDLAPASFERQIEEGTEPSAGAVAAMNALITHSKVKVLLYNSQAVSPITARLRTLALRSHVPVVPVTETLPRGLTYQHWQLDQIDALGKALGR